MARDISIRPNATSDGKGDVMQECSVPDLWSHVGHFSGKDLPHDWKVQRVFLGFAAYTFIKIQLKRSTSPDSKTASRDPAAAAFFVSG
jgi:hypothetical protein